MNYARRMLIPAFAKAGATFSYSLPLLLGPVRFKLVVNLAFLFATTDVPSLISDPSCNTVVIATRHDSHASLVKEALRAGKHIFVEKPLCLTFEELKTIEQAYNENLLLMVGFNRRFAPLILADLKQQLQSLNGPKSFIYTCNAGSIPTDHWTQDPLVGGGRLLGEACHFVDLLRFLAGSPIQDIRLFATSQMTSLGQIPSLLVD